MEAAVFIAISIDGFIARKNGGIDWLSSVERPGEDYGYAQFFAGVDALVMGRSTHDVVRAFAAWPYGDKPVIVMTHRPIEPVHGERAFAGEARALAAELSEQGVKRIYVDGGAVIRQFVEANLVEELTLSVLPVTLGDGIPLFGGRELEQRWSLVGAQAYDSGLAQLRYRRRPGS